MKKIDVHFHLIENIHGLGAKGILRDLGNGTGQYENGEIVRLIPEEYGSKISPETFVSLMKQHDVEKAVALQGHYAGIQNLYTKEAMQNFPDKILGAAMYDPFYKKADEVREYLFEDLKFGIIKMEMSNTSGLMCNHPVIDLNGKMMNEVYKYAEEHGLIFYIDIGRPGNICYQVKALRKVIKKYPSMTFIVCHLTAPQHNQKKLLEKNLKLLNLPNCYFDIASLFNNVKDEYPFLETQSYIRVALDIAGNDKIMWGTDFPSAMKNTTYEQSYKYIEDSKLFTTKEKQMILYENARRVFSKFF
jgi:predicted TIM-barrel fold metal-dependent hydrolase